MKVSKIIQTATRLTILKTHMEKALQLGLFQVLTAEAAQAAKAALLTDKV